MDCCEITQDDAKTGADGDKMRQDGAKMAPRWAKMAPRWRQDGALVCQRWRQDGPRWRQDGVKMDQNGDDDDDDDDGNVSILLSQSVKRDVKKMLKRNNQVEKISYRCKQMMKPHLQSPKNIDQKSIDLRRSL